MNNNKISLVFLWLVASFGALLDGMEAPKEEIKIVQKTPCAKKELELFYAKEGYSSSTIVLSNSGSTIAVARIPKNDDLKTMVCLLDAFSGEEKGNISIDPVFDVTGRVYPAFISLIMMSPKETKLFVGHQDGMQVFDIQDMKNPREINCFALYDISGRGIFQHIGVNVDETVFYAIIQRCRSESDYDCCMGVLSKETNQDIEEFMNETNQYALEKIEGPTYSIACYKKVRCGVESDHVLSISSPDGKWIVYRTIEQILEQPDDPERFKPRCIAVKFKLVFKELAGAAEKVFEIDFPYLPVSIAFSPDGKQCAVGALFLSSSKSSFHDDGLFSNPSVCIVDLETFRITKKINSFFTIEEGIKVDSYKEYEKQMVVCSIDYSKDGKTLFFIKCEGFLGRIDPSLTDVDVLSSSLYSFDMEKESEDALSRLPIEEKKNVYLEGKGDVSSVFATVVTSPIGTVFINTGNSVFSFYGTALEKMLSHFMLLQPFLGKYSSKKQQN